MDAALAAEVATLVTCSVTVGAEVAVLDWASVAGVVDDSSPFGLVASFVACSSRRGSVDATGVGSDMMNVISDVELSLEVFKQSLCWDRRVVSKS